MRMPGKVLGGVQMLNGLTIAYLFLGGVGAGMCVVLTWMSWCYPAAGLRLGARGPHAALSPGAGERRLYGMGCAVAVAVQALGLVCLLFDVGRPNKVLVMLLSPHVSVTSVGAYALAALVALSMLLTLAWMGGLRVRRAVLVLAGAFAVVVSLVVMVYTALLLRAFAGVEFWDSWLLAALFGASSVSTGLAGTVLAAVASGASLRYRGLVDLLLRCDVWVIALEAAVLVLYLLYGVQAAPDAVGALLAGDLATVFWAGVVGCALVVPCALNLGSRVLAGLQVHPGALAVLVLVGGFCLRWCVALVPR